MHECVGGAFIFIFCFKENAVDTGMAVVLTQTNAAFLNISQSRQSG